MTRLPLVAILSIAILDACGTAVASGATRSAPRVFLQVSGFGGLCIERAEQRLCWLGQLRPDFGEGTERSSDAWVSIPMHDVVATAFEATLCDCRIDGRVRCLVSGGSSSGCNIGGVGDCRELAMTSLSSCVLGASREVQCGPRLVPTQVSENTEEVRVLSHEAPTADAQVSESAGTCSWSAATVAGLPHVIHIAGNNGASCAIVDSDTGPVRQVVCWGLNNSGQLTDGVMVDGFVHTGVSQAEQISMGRAGTCVIASEEVLCWGGYAAMPSLERRRQCAAVPMSDVSSVRRFEMRAPVCRETAPVRVPEILGPTSIRVGAERACALDEAGALWCWGEFRPQIMAEHVRDFDMSNQDGCLVSESGEVWCWGALSRMPTPDGVVRPFVRDAPGNLIARWTGRDLEVRGSTQQWMAVDPVTFSGEQSTVAAHPESAFDRP